MAGRSGTTPPKGNAHTGGRKPVSWQKRKRLAELHAEGKSRNAIAKALGISTGVVSRIAAELGLTFDRRPSLKAAIEMAQWDAKAARAAASQGLMEDFAKMRAMLFSEVDRVHYSVTLGEQHYMATPSSGEIKDLFIAMGIALDKHAMLSKFDSDDRDLPAVDQWLMDRMGLDA